MPKISFQQVGVKVAAFFFSSVFCPGVTGVVWYDVADTVPTAVCFVRAPRHTRAAHMVGHCSLVFMNWAEPFHRDDKLMLPCTLA